MRKKEEPRLDANSSTVLASQGGLLEVASVTFLFLVPGEDFLKFILVFQAVLLGEGYYVSEK